MDAAREGCFFCITGAPRQGRQRSMLNPNTLNANRPGMEPGASYMRNWCDTTPPCLDKLQVRARYDVRNAALLPPQKLERVMPEVPTLPSSIKGLTRI